VSKIINLTIIKKALTLSESMILLVVPPGSKPVKYSLLHKTRHLLVNVFKTHTFNRLYLKTSNLIKRILIVIFSFLFTTCIEPIAPEFDFLEDLLFIEGMASSIEGASYVKVRIGSNESGYYKTDFFSNCLVELISDNRVVKLIEGLDRYYAPLGFKVLQGESWELKIIFPDGTEYRSYPETMPDEVLIKDIKSEYDLQLSYDNRTNRYIPGHKILISFDDPIEKENFYYYDYKTYEDAPYCDYCYKGVLRDGECISTSGYISTYGPQYFTYACFSDCWNIRFNNESISIFSDEFTNGKPVNNLVAVELPLYSKRNILVKVQKFNVSYEAHRYLKSLKDAIGNNSGLNAPLPSVLIGNLYNPNDEDEIIMGRFTVASGSSKSIYIRRNNLAGNAVSEYEQNHYEKFGDNVPQPLCATCYPIYAPCEEGLYRTSIKPEGWNSNMDRGFIN